MSERTLIITEKCHHEKDTICVLGIRKAETKSIGLRHSREHESEEKQNEREELCQNESKFPVISHKEKKKIIMFSYKATTIMSRKPIKNTNTRKSNVKVPSQYGRVRHPMTLSAYLILVSRSLTGNAQ